MQYAGHEPVGWIEKNKFSRRSYNAIYDTEKEWTARDAREVVLEEIPDFKCLCAGFPCQSFSPAGREKGFEDIRGTLFFEIARIAKRKLPQILFLENVKGLLNNSNGKSFRKVLQTLDELGYYVEWQVLNSKHFGVPQSRKRVFIVGHLGGKPRRTIFPFTRKAKEDHGGVMPVFTPDYTKKDMNKTSQLGSSDGYMWTVDATSQHGVLKNGRIRKLTPKETWRLQGFPDWAYKRARVVNSVTQLWQQAGNAVTVNVVEAIAERLINSGKG